MRRTANATTSGTLGLRLMVGLVCVVQQIVHSRAKLTELAMAPGVISESTD